MAIQYDDREKYSATVSRWIEIVSRMEIYDEARSPLRIGIHRKRLQDEGVGVYFEVVLQLGMVDSKRFEGAGPPL